MEEKEMMIEGVNESFNYTYADAFIMEDLANRILILNSEIDENVIEGIIYHILRYNRVDRDTAIADRKPIILYINSPGGNISDGFALIDAIKASETPVYTVNLGCCDSMALLVFMSGDKRFSMMHSEFLLHDGFTGIRDSTAKVRDRMDFETKVIDAAIKDFVTSNSNISNKLYKEKYRSEYYFFPHEAKKLGVADFIVGEDCSINEII